MYDLIGPSDLHDDPRYHISTRLHFFCHSPLPELVLRYILLDSVPLEKVHLLSAHFLKQFHEYYIRE